MHLLDRSTQLSLFMNLVMQLHFQYNAIDNIFICFFAMFQTTNRIFTYYTFISRLLRMVWFSIDPCLALYMIKWPIVRRILCVQSKHNIKHLNCSHYATCSSQLLCIEISSLPMRFWPNDAIFANFKTLHFDSSK